MNCACHIPFASRHKRYLLNIPRTAIGDLTAPAAPAAPAAPRARPARAAARAAVKQEPVEPEAATGPVAQVAPVPEAPPEPPVEEPLSPCLRLEGARKNQGKSKGGTTKAGEIAKKRILMFKKKNEASKMRTRLVARARFALENFQKPSRSEHFWEMRSAKCA